MAHRTDRPVIRRTALRRSRRSDPVTPALREAVLRRDGGCVLAMRDALHVCRDRLGGAHAPGAVHLLSMEHVHEGYGMAGKRAASDLRHVVALCYGANLKPPSKDERAWMREYLSRVAS